MKRLLASIAVCVCVVQARAQTKNDLPPDVLARSTFNGATLFDWCSSEQKSAAFARCALYIDGFVTGFVTATSTADEHRSSVFCLPPNLTSGEAIAAFVRLWRSADQSKTKLLGKVTPQYALSTVLSVAFPCKTAN
jgi:Rap1a immunity proteins